MNNKKLKLNELKVQSFVTSIEKREIETVKGGTGNSNNPVCNTAVAACQNTIAAVCPETTGPNVIGTPTQVQNTICTLNSNVTVCDTEQFVCMPTDINIVKGCVQQ